ncbi:unnamed protein product [Pleuronectes platessa]|uniref:Uncharacterized protein n=1 Tax=Pleuronectes platessa TaxID=8262 RepID=A0A9N7VFR7_PLEPL|nr:unnamed protein product [Pleuronectes platessa]
MLSDSVKNFVGTSVNTIHPDQAALDDVESNLISSCLTEASTCHLDSRFEALVPSPPTLRSLPAGGSRWTRCNVKNEVHVRTSGS